MRTRFAAAVVLWVTATHLPACSPDRKASHTDTAGNPSAGSHAPDASASANASAGSEASDASVPAKTSAGSHASQGAAGSGGVAANGGASGRAAPIGTGSVNADAKGFTASLLMKQVPAGGEEHRCVVVELPNTEPVWVDQLHATLGEGSHHLIVDRQPTSGTLQPVAQTCSPTMAGDQTRLMIAQQRDTRVTLPSGVAYKLDVHQHVFLQLHFINLKDKPVDIQGSIELLIADGSSATPKEAHSVFTGSTGFQLPARMRTTVRSFLAGKPAQGQRHVFALTSHTHQLGVHSTIERVANLDAAATTPIHESLDWAEPPLTQFTPALVFSNGNAADGFRLTCEYDNQTDHTVSFGTGFNDEMCFMWMYFYDE